MSSPPVVECFLAVLDVVLFCMSCNPLQRVPYRLVGFTQNTQTHSHTHNALAIVWIYVFNMIHLRRRAQRQRQGTCQMQLTRGAMRTLNIHSGTSPGVRDAWRAINHTAAAAGSRQRWRYLFRRTTRARRWESGWNPAARHLQPERNTHRSRVAFTETRKQQPVH